MVVVEHDQHVQAGDAGIVQGLISHARTQGAVANDRHHLARLAAQLGRFGHAQRGRDAGGRMRRAKGVVGALFALGKAADAALLAQAAHARAAPGQDFVRIGLMAHVPDQAVVRRVVHMVQGHGQLDRAQIGTQVSARAGHGVQQKIAQGLRHPLQLGHGQWFEAARVGPLLQHSFHETPSPLGVRSQYTENPENVNSD